MLVRPGLEPEASRSVDRRRLSNVANRAAVGSLGSWGGKGGAAVRALASHQCGLGFNPGVDAMCGLSLLLVFFLAPRGFSPVPQFPLSSETDLHL